MDTIDLTDVTFLIQVRIDSKQRAGILTILLQHISSHFNTSTIVLECDRRSKIDLSSYPDVEHIFQIDHSPIFYKTKNNNTLLALCKTPYGILQDSDVLAEPQAVHCCMRQLRSQRHHFALPGDGRLVEVNSIYQNVITKMGSSTSVFSTAELPMLTHNCVGGLFICHVQQYRAMGGDNEKIIGWGHDDIERIIRIKRKGYGVYRASYRLYHLWHPRKENSFFFNDELMKTSYSALIESSK